MTLTLLDYENRKMSFDIGDIKIIDNIKITVLSGDEVATVTYNNGDQVKFDSCEEGGRLISYYDGEYVLYDKATKKNWLKRPGFVFRRNSYDFMNM